MKNLIMAGIRMKLECTWILSDSDGNRKCNHNDKDEAHRPRINQSYKPDDMHFN